MEIAQIAESVWCFKLINGKTWKSKLRNLYDSGENVDPGLQRFRNVYGLEVLAKMKGDIEITDIRRILRENT